MTNQKLGRSVLRIPLKPKTGLEWGTPTYVAGTGGRVIASLTCPRQVGSSGCATLHFVIPTGVFMGRRPTQGDEKRLSCSNCSPWARYPPPCHPERSRGTCGSADLSWKCFSTERTRISCYVVLPHIHVCGFPFKKAA